MTDDLTTWTPQQVDEALAEIHGRISRAHYYADRQWDDVRRMAARVLGRKSFSASATATETHNLLSEVDETPEADRTPGQRNLWTAFEAYETLRDEITEAILETQPYDEEWERRGRWTRAFLVVTNGQGHVHRSMHCSTCNKGVYRTQFHWLTELSDHDEAEIILAAGEGACTVCYPNAPTEATSRPRSVFTKDEERKARDRAEREAKRTKAAAEKIELTGYFDYSDRPHDHTFKTVRGATNAIASHLSSLCHYGTSHPSAANWLSDIQNIREALAQKGVEYDYDSTLAKVRKRVEKEARQGAWGDPNFKAQF